MKSTSVKKLLGFMVLFSLMVQMPSQIVFADVSLSITPEQQQMSNWCWAATSVSVAKFYGKTTLVIGGNGGMPTTTVPTTQSNHVYKVAGSFTYNQPRSLSLVQTISPVVTL